jgi:hypothetical protein
VDITRKKSSGIGLMGRGIGGKIAQNGWQSPFFISGKGRICLGKNGICQSEKAD